MPATPQFFVDALPVSVSGATSSAVSDNGPSWTTVRGISGAPFTSANQSSAFADCSDSPTTGQKLVITDLFISVDTAMNVRFQGSDSDDAFNIGPFYMAANSSLQLTPRSKGWKSTKANSKLQVKTSASGNIMVDAFYFSEA